MEKYSEETLRKAKETKTHPDFWHYGEMQGREILKRQKKIITLTSALGVLGFVALLIQCVLLFQQNQLLQESNKLLRSQQSSQDKQWQFENQSRKKETISIVRDTVYIEKKK